MLCCGSIVYVCVTCLLQPTVGDLHAYQPVPPMSPHSKMSLQCIDENQMLGPAQANRLKGGSCGAESASSTEMAGEALDIDYSSDHSSHEPVFHVNDDFNGNSRKTHDHNSHKYICPASVSQINCLIYNVIVYD